MQVQTFNSLLTHVQLIKTFYQLNSSSEFPTQTEIVFISFKVDSMVKLGEREKGETTEKAQGPL